MSINQFTINFPGQNNIVPRIGHLYAPKNTLSQISAAGYLDAYIKSQGFSVLPTDFIAAVGSDGSQWFRPSFSNGICTLNTLP